MNPFQHSQLVLALSLALVPTAAFMMGCTDDHKADVVAAHATGPSPKAATRATPIASAAAASNINTPQRADAPVGDGKDGGKDGGYVHGDGGKDGGYIQDHHDGGTDGGMDKDGGK